METKPSFNRNLGSHLAGKAYLIGAGPGDPELLTLKAVRALGEADVALVDDLVNRDILQHLRPGARVIEVGKRGWKGKCGQSTPQPFIQRQMICYARLGYVVARVKGGDPFVFGRGGEEMQALQAAGIPVEVVNGITSGLAAPAALGIPVTHRDCSRGVTLVTGHTRNGETPDWRALAAAGTTLVIYMGMAHLARITKELRQAGMDAHTPVALIQNGTLAAQRSVLTTLAGAAEAAATSAIGSPAIIVVGDVVRFANQAAVLELESPRRAA